MVLLWTCGCCFMVTHGQVMTQQLLMVLGFAAILTIFMLQYPLLFGITLGVVATAMYVLMLQAAGPEDYHRIRVGAVRSLLVVAPLILLAAWVRLRPLRRGELAVIYASVVIAIPWCITIKAVLESSTANLFEVQRRSEPQMYAWARQMPWWGPALKTPDVGEVTPAPATAPAASSPAPAATAAIDDDMPVKAPDELALDGFLRGNGGRVPWELWWRPMVYWVGMCLCYEGMLMGLLLMFRRRWIEHERLPFVWSYPALTLIRREQNDIQPRRRWVMFLVGLAFCLPATILVSPTGEPLSTWGAPPWVGTPGLRGGFDLTDLNILPGVNLRLFWGPLVLTFLLLFPLDVLMTVALTYIVMMILAPGIMRSLGFEIGPQRLLAFNQWGLRFGGCAGLFLWSLWYNRRTLWGYIRSMWGSKPTNMESADEIPRKVVVGVFIAGLVGFFLFGLYATTWPQMLFLMGFIFIYAIAQVRQRAEGQLMTYDNNFGSHQMASLQRDLLHDHYTLASSGQSVPVTGSSWATHWMQWGFNGQLKSYGAHNMLLEAFKIGHEVKANARHIAWAILGAMLLVALITPPLYLKLMYTYGFENSYQGALSIYSNFLQWSERAASYGLHSTSNVFYVPATNFYDRYQNIFNATYGIVLIGVLFYLRREFPRFPISPVGVVLAAENFSMGYGMPISPEYIWFSFLLAGVFKGLVFRWVGVKSFREKIQPAVIMLLCGMIFGLMLYLLRYVSLGIGTLK